MDGWCWVYTLLIRASWDGTTEGLVFCTFGFCIWIVCWMVGWLVVCISWFVICMSSHVVCAFSWKYL